MKKILDQVKILNVRVLIPCLSENQTYFRVERLLHGYAISALWVIHKAQTPFRGLSFNIHFALQTGIFNHRAFHPFGQAKFFDSGSILGSSQFSILP